MLKQHRGGNITFITKNKFVYEQLRKSIISGELKPESRLIIDKLAKQFGVSGIPIREAITKLSVEGLVMHIPHVGAHVTPVNHKELEENFIIRAELEGLATFHAAQHLTDRDFEELERNNARMRRAIERRKFSELGFINKEFHRTIYKACPYRKLYKMIFALWDDIERVQSVFALVPSSGASSLIEHEKILRALQRKNSLLSQSLVIKQKQRTWRDLKSFLSNNQESANQLETATGKKILDDHKLTKTIK